MHSEVDCRYLLGHGSFPGNIAGGFVQNTCDILRISQKEVPKSPLKDHLTLRLYLVVTLVARTPFLMLLVARWFKTVWLG